MVGSPHAIPLRFTIGGIVAGRIGFAPCVEVSKLHAIAFHNRADFKPIVARDAVLVGKRYELKGYANNPPRLVIVGGIDALIVARWGG